VLGTSGSKSAFAPVKREVRELLHLPRRDLGEFLAAVADLHREQPGEPVQVALAVGVPDVGAFAAHDHRDVGLVVGGVAGEVQPEVAASSLGEIGGSGGHTPRFSRHGQRVPHW
jgi:hypothetical protein